PGTDIPSPPVRGGVNPNTDIPSPPIRGGVNPGTDIPSPPIRGGVNPNTDIPSPPIRGVASPGTDIPSPPVRRVTDSETVVPGTDIPSPPIRGGVALNTDIPSPPIRGVSDPSTDIPSPPVRTGVGPSIDIPSPPIRPLTGVGGTTVLDGSGSPGADLSIQGETVELHSSLGASRVIQLDFNGASVSGTVWNEAWFQGQSFVAPAFDRDGTPRSLNAVERAQIVEIWKRVSEDFAPFDVDVTTAEDAGAISSGRGIRVLVTPMAQLFSGYSGISYVGSFGSSGHRWNTVLVFPDAIGLDQTKAIAEAISHQVGHSLGLFHHGLLGGSPVFAGIGSGDASWAPIMGDASVRSLSRWSRGDYAGADNAQDDIAVIQSGGLPLREDDHGDSVDAASHLPLGTRWTVGGLVGRIDDRDVFAFESGQGVVSLQVSPEEVGANLDVEARLLDSSGVTVAESAPVDTLGSRFDLVVPAGRYFLVVMGNGYGSLGRYTVAGVVPEPVRHVPPISVIGPTPAIVEAFVPVVFDGSLSFDLDDTIASYVWDFGDGTRTEGVTVTHAFQIPGSYGVTLTVTDESGLSHSSAFGLRITPPNLAPQAVISSDATSGHAPLAVVFDGSRSVDPDGSVVAHRWDFGDGQVVEGSLVRREFTRPGVHRVTLTVVDNQGAESSVTTSITVSQREIFVGSITVRTVASGLSRTAHAVVRITTPEGSPVVGATVTGSWMGAVAQSRGVKTDANGVVEIASPRVTRSTKMTFTVTGVALENARYTPALNRASSLTVVVGP
ncbi:MAG: PKD domain-containing protein, partial [Limisphaerales bacterium]